MPELSLELDQTRLSFTARRQVRVRHIASRSRAVTQNSYELVFLSLLALAQVARAAMFQRFRDQSSYASIDTTNIWTVAAVLLACLWWIGSGALKTLLLQTRTPLRWYGFYLGYCGLSVLWSGRLAYGAFRVLELTVNLVLMLRIMELLGNKRRALTYLVWGAGLTSLLGLAGLWRSSGVGFWFHSNDVPMAGGMCVLLCLGGYMTGALPLRVLALPAVPGFLALIGGTSAGSNVAVALSLSLLLLLSAWAGKRQIGYLVVVGSTALALSIALASRDSLKAVLFPGKDTANIFSVTGRTEVWRDYFQMFAQNPVFGGGFPAGEKEVTVGLRSGSGTTGSTHNMIMSVLVNTGLIGLTFYSVWLATTLSLLWKALRDRRRSAEALPLLGCLMVAMVNSLTLPVLGSHWIYPVMIVYGVVAYAAVYLRKNTPPRSKPMERRMGRRILDCRLLAAKHGSHRPAFLYRA